MKEIIPKEQIISITNLEVEKYYFKDIENQIYYYEFVANDYQIRELKLSKDNWNEYNILLAEGTEEEVQAFLKDCFDNVFEDFEHITDTEIVDRPNYVGTDFLNLRL